MYILLKSIHLSLSLNLRNLNFLLLGIAFFPLKIILTVKKNPNNSTAFHLIINLFGLRTIVFCMKLFYADEALIGKCSYIV